MSLTDTDREQIKILCNKCEAVAKAVNNHVNAVAVLDTLMEDIRDGLMLLADKIAEEKPEEEKNNAVDK